MEIQLVITYTPENGQVNVSGPLENKILCFGMIEVAKLSIAAHQAEAPSKIVRPMIVPMGRG